MSAIYFLASYGLHFLNDRIGILDENGKSHEIRSNTKTVADSTDLKPNITPRATVWDALVSARILALLFHQVVERSCE